MCIIGIPFLMMKRPALWWFVRGWAKGIEVILKLTAGIDHQLFGAERIGGDPVIIAAKHQSAWETIIFCLAVPRPIFILKQELIDIPLFGLYPKTLGMIPVARDAGAGAMRQMLRDASTRVEEGYNLIIFPEGTRAAIGMDAPYQPGVVGLYRHLKIPVVPAALNSGLKWRRNSFIKHPGRISVSFLPPIQPGLKRDDFLEKLSNAIETETHRLVTTEQSGQVVEKAEENF